MSRKIQCKWLKRSCHILWTRCFSQQSSKLSEQLNLPANQKEIEKEKKKIRNRFYYMNTNEIRGELSRENLPSSHVKISPLLWQHDIAPFTPKNYWSEMVWYFIGVYIINRTLHGRLEIRNFSSRVEKIFHSFAIFFNTRREISYLRAAM